MKKILFKKKYYAEGGDISLDMCYVNYNGYQIQSTRCKEEGVDFIMHGEYRDVARDLKKYHPNEWLYYNRMSRIYIDVNDALNFVKQANEHFKPSVNINSFFYDIDRSFATYYVRNNEPKKDIEINVGGMTRTDEKPSRDKVKNKNEQKKIDLQLARREKQEPPIIKANQWKGINGLYWYIGMVVNQGGGDAYFDREWKNKIVNKHLPVDNGISLFTLIHEYAHCLDYNNSIKRGKTYQVPAYEMELTLGEDFVGNEYSKEELKMMRKANEMGMKKTTLLSTHGDFFIEALAMILEAGSNDKIPILNNLDNQVSLIEKKIGGESYLDKQRDDMRNEMMQRMAKKIALANTPYLRFSLPEPFVKFIEESEIGYIGKLPNKEINVDLGMELLPYLIDYETFLKDRMYVNPTENSKLLEDIKKIRVDIGRMIKRLGE
jgi:hypothetical protein